MSTFSHLSSWNFESGFQVMLRICLVFPVKISSHQSPVFAVPPMEDYWTRDSQAPCGWNAGNFVTKITTKKRDDSMVNFRQYIWSAYLVFMFVFNETETLTILMGFTVTSSDYKVKKARFYAFLFTLGWRLTGNKSWCKFPAPKHVSFQKYSNLNFRVFKVRDTKIGMLSPWKKVSQLDFQQFNHFKF